MGPRAKIIFGALLVIGGIWWYVPNGPFNSMALTFSTLSNLQSLVAMVQGGLGILAVLVGIFIVWIETDELRIQREMAERDVEEFAAEFEAEEESAEESGDVEDAGEEGFVCEECGDSFDTERGLNIHKGMEH